MRWAPAAILALALALACAGSTACGGSSGGDTVTITEQHSFAQGLLPVAFTRSQGSGDVALRVDGDLYAVDGRTAIVTRVSRTNGDVTAFADAGALTSALTSIATGFGDDQRLFAGDVDGVIWSIDTTGTVNPTPFFDTGTGQAITGLSFAPDGFTGFGGQLFAAAGTGGIWRSGDSTQAFTSGNYVDLGFSGSALLALDDTADQLSTVSTSGVATALPSTPAFDDPVGMAVDSSAAEIYVADAGDDVLYTVPVAGGAHTARAAYAFDGDAPSGIVFDGFAALAFVTTDPPAIRGVNLPRINPANANFGLLFTGPTVGYGDLEFDRTGMFVMAANDDDDPQVSGDSTNNFLFSVSRDHTTAAVLASGINAPTEQLLGVALDPEDNTIYVSTESGDVFRRTADGAAPELLVSVTNAALLGLELVPAAFGADPGEDLVATSENGEVFLIHSEARQRRLLATINATSGSRARLSDLVFALDGTLYVVDNGQSQPLTGNPRILIVDAAGGVNPLPNVNPAQLGRPDGIEIDEGADRLLVPSETSGGGRLLAVDIGSGAVTAVANIAIPRGYFPTGVVYDRLGTAVVHERENGTALGAHSVAPN